MTSLTPNEFNNHNQPSVPAHAILSIPKGVQAHIPPGKFIAVDEEVYGAGRQDAPIPFSGFSQQGGKIRTNSVTHHAAELIPAGPEQDFGLRAQNYGSYIYINRPWAAGGGTDANHIRYN